MRVDTTVLASEAISGGVNSFFQEGYVVSVTQLQRVTKRVRNKAQFQ